MKSSKISTGINLERKFCLSIILYSWNCQELTIYNYSVSFNLFLLLPGTTSFIFWLTRLCSLTITSQITVTGSFLNQPWRWKILRTTCCPTVIFTCWACWPHTRRQLSSKQVTPCGGDAAEHLSLRSPASTTHRRARSELHCQLGSGKQSALKALGAEEGLFFFFVQAVKNCSSPWV